mgnify:CR=1 FL=1
MLAARATAIFDAEGPAESWPRALFIEDETHFTLAVGCAERAVVDDDASPAEVLEAAFRLAERAPRVACGVRFDRRGESSEWDAFGAGLCFAPRASIVRDGESLTGVDDVLRLVALSPRPTLEPTSSSSPSALDDVGAFHALGAAALRAIDEGTLAKVVLARRSLQRVRVAPGALARSLGVRDAGLTYAFSPRPGVAYVGRTPERLLAGFGGAYRTEAVAGTAPRFDEAKNDELSRAALLASEKDRREHAFVVEHITASVAAASGHAVVGARGLRTAGAVHHLVTPIDVSIAPAHVGDLVAKLHPTPALAGWPVRDAVSFIRQHEGFDRGLYGGLVGWISSSALDLRVAIRGALLDQDRATIFVGAGFVAGSEVERERRETEVKARAIVDALAREGAHG